MNGNIAFNMINEWLLIMANGLLMCLFVILANEWILIMASGLQILILYIYIDIYIHTMVYYGKYLVAHPTDRK